MESVRLIITLIILWHLISSFEEASLDFFHPELTNCTISVELKFDAPLRENVELLFMEERVSTVSVRSDRKIAN